MKSVKKSIIRISVALLFLMGGLTTGGIMSANASGDCPREACNDNKTCEWYGNMTTCSSNHSNCTDGPCKDPGVN